MAAFHRCSSDIILSALIYALCLSLALSQEEGWGPWTDYSRCSRSCGGGVQQSSRQCLTGRIGGTSCQGQSVQYQSCNVQDCPPGSPDFRGYQCSSYNTYLQQGWTPYYDPASPCALLCRNSAGHIQRLRETVIDGTTCDNGKTFGVCISGVCKPVGCDHILGSVRAEDKCLVCGGTGENCQTFTGTTLDRTLNPDTSTEVTTFPVGATKLTISLSSPAPSALELISDKGKSLKLTEATISFGQRKIADFAGTHFNFGFLEDGMTFSARGPVNETLRLLVRYQQLSPLVEYEYSLAQPQVAEDEPPRQDQRYAWSYGSWTSCSTECGPGYQRRSVMCMDRERRESVSNSLCSQDDMPEPTQSCNPGPCQGSLADGYKWVPGHWGECSVECGLGEHTQLQHCIETGVTGDSVYAEDELCTRYVGSKPVYTKACYGDSDYCPYWATGAWSQCSVTCGYGLETRRVFCQRDPADENQDPVVLDDNQCSYDKRPERTQLCSRTPCADGSNRDADIVPLEDRAGSGQDCRNSKYGCCPDNVTPAQGPDFIGCKDHLLENGDPCEAPSERGPCANYTIKWYFDTKEKDCLRFWYGGCEGNKNRYEDRDSCRNQCLKSSLKPAGCAASAYGCCADGVTYARGPNRDGCPERNRIGGCAGTRHGCCDDGVTSARGPNREGCPEERPLIGGCAGTQHGCCEDGVTSARGPNKEGCPERRPLIGGCAGTRYGCCADRVTAASGPDRLGCPENTMGTRVIVGGCRGTRYGCCADGVTAARGENRLGCAENPFMSCRDTRYGCCEDGTTAASGPNREGCPETKNVVLTGCQSSRYGCCPDGVTAAQGLNEEGCPNFDQASCAQPKDAGTCTDYTLHWHFETTFGMCRQFWFGGCGGNQNRFPSKEECEAKCVEVKGSGACRLPSIVGPCKASKRRFFFNHEKGRCESFNYGGCKGNNNNFHTLGECQAACNGAVNTQGTTTSGCDSYPCQNGFTCQDYWNGTYSCSCNPDWGQNCERPPDYWCFSDRECDQGLKCVQERRCMGGQCFVYSRCAPASKRYVCDSPRCPSNQDCVNDDSFSDGHICVNKIAYTRPYNLVLGCDKSEFGCCPDRRTPAYGPNYAGCQQRCQETRYGCCLDGVTSAEGPDYEGCEMGSGDVPCETTEFGCCDDGFTAAKGPRGRGCDGDTPDSEDRGREPSSGHGSSTGDVVVTDTRPEKCKAPAPRDRCDKEYVIKWRYEEGKQACERHWWGGCADNGNVFDTEDACEAECIETIITEPDNEDPDFVFVNVCDMPEDPGPCRARIPRYFYNRRESNCGLFYYGGCQGNENNFVSLEDCQRECMGGVIREDVTTTTQAPRTIPPPTREVTLSMSGQSVVKEGSELKVSCSAIGPNQVQLEWFINGQSVNGNDGRIEMRGRSTVTSDGYQQVAELIVPYARAEDAGTYYCRSSDGKLERMVITVSPAYQPRTTTESPIDVDVDNSITMTGQALVEAGSTITLSCQAVGPRRPSDVEWFINGRLVDKDQQGPSINTYSDPRSRNTLVSELTIRGAAKDHEGTYYCRSRPYGDLEKMVVTVQEQRVTTQAPTSDDPAAVCVTDFESGNCYASIPRWYYDYHDGVCRQFTYGGCGGNNNNFETEQQCNNYCSAQVVCTLPKVIGRCRAAMPRFYFDTQTKSCQEFLYGGCHGNLNNFATAEACNKKCAEYSQGGGGTEVDRGEDVCQLNPDKGTCQGYEIKWYYSSARNRCARFVFTGCDGNGNRFDSEDECEGRCVRDDGAGERPIYTYRPPATTQAPIPTTTEFRGSVCSLPKSAGDCADYTILWYYDTERRRCLRFYYGGCGGNGNRFESEADCERQCVYGEATTERPEPSTNRPVPCYFSRYGCCDDGVTTAVDSRKSNCEESNVIVQPGGEHTIVLVKRGADAFLRCSIGSQNVLWYRDGFLLSTSRRFQVLRNGTLVLRDVTEDMAGIYACRTANGNTLPQLERFKVEVNVPLNILPGPALMSIKPGEMAFMHCQAVGNPQPRISWEREGQVLRSNGHYRVFGNGTLIIDSIRADDAGTFECSAENGVAPAVSRKINLRIEESIDADIQRHEGIYMEGDTIHLTCRGTGYPTPSVEWQKDGTVLSTGEKYRVSGGDLMINSAAIEDAGMYKCVVSNSRDRAEDVTTIQIKFHSPQTQCEDTMRRTKCHLIVAGRLCGFRIFAQKCCQSCRRAGYL